MTYPPLGLFPPEGVLVELCAGLAALTFSTLGVDGPVTYPGGKRGYVADLRRHLEVRRPARVVLVEADPAVAAGLAVLFDQELRARAVELLEEWAVDPELQEARWRELVPGYPWAEVEVLERGTRFLWAARRAGSSGIRRAWFRPHRRAYQAGRNVVEPWVQWALDDPASALRAMPPTPHVEVVEADVRTFEPIPGATVSFDPPYQAGTIDYLAELPRADVLEVVERHRAAGCLVGVTEAEELAGATSTHELRYRGPRARTYSKTREVLSLFTPTAEV